MHPAALLLQATLDIAGIVLGPSGKPVPKATVQAGAAKVQTDAHGRFRLAVPEGVATVRISAPGLEPQERDVRAGGPLYVRLEPAVVEARVDVVEGSAFGSEGTPQAALTTFEIYTTPGAAADVFQAAKTLPGVSNASEGAELFVRGGRPDEVGIFLNGGHLRHPFHHPSAQGGIFSAVDTAIVTTLNFIPGGFSARYGDALSAVLDLATDQPTVRRGGTAGLNATQAALEVDEPLAGGVLRAAARHADSVLLDRWFSLARTFTESPVSTNTHLGWSGALGGKGRLSLMALGSRDHLGVDTRIANLDALYASRSQTGYLSAQATQVVSDRLALVLDLSRETHDQRWHFGPWGIAQTESSTFHRVEATWTPQADLTVESGLDGERAELSPDGRVPYDLADWTPGRPARTFRYAFHSPRDGAYVTLKARLGGAWGLSLGGRTDRYGLMHERTRDIRATLSWQASPRVVLRAATGTFHQSPTLTDLDPFSGNPDLKTQRAHHALVSLDAKDEQGPTPWQIRLEAYRKTYDRLIVEPVPRHYEGTGRGEARGLDLLLKARHGRFRGWLGYGYLDTRRRQDLQLALGPVPTSIPHNLTLVGAFAPREGWEVSSSFRLASGAPFTPILGGTPDGQGGWLPVEGPRFSDRLPTYQRLDLRITHFFSVDRFRCVAYLETLNLLDRRNPSGCSYSPDFQTRREEPSYFAKRVAVGGLQVSW